MSDEQTPQNEPEDPVEPDEPVSPEPDEQPEAEPTVQERLDARKEELAERDEADAEAEKYRRRVAILLAAVAVLGAWIAVLQTNAGTNESATARETTRTAVEAQSASVITEGLQAMKTGAQAEIETIPLRTTFTQELGAFLPERSLPFTDVERIADGMSIAAEISSETLDADPELLFGLAVEQREKSLERDALTEERITWNARASQYETVVTVLGVSLFLIGFTLVLSRKIRPPILIPGLILVCYCFGWALWIYNKPIPDVDRDAITATATGDVELELGEADAAVESLDEAIEIDDDYLPPYAVRSIANATLANPDLLETFAIVDNSSDEFQAAIDDAVRAVELGGDEDITTLAIASVLAMAANEYEIAHDAISQALELNENSPGLYLFSSVIDLATGDVDAASAELDQALTFIQPNEPSGRIRTLAADYFTWLGWVEDQNPDLAEDAARLSEQMVAAEAFLTEGVEQTGVVPPGAGIRLNDADFENGEARFDLELLGVDDNDYIVILVFERPSEGGPWIQSEQLAFVGPAVTTESTGNPVEITRACHPVEFRTDLYVEGVFVGTDSVPGVAATC